MIGAVVTYRNNGSRRICGQTIGADGRGTFAVIFESKDVNQASVASTKFIEDLEKYSEYPGHISEIHLVLNEQSAFNSFVTIKRLKL